MHTLRSLVTSVVSGVAPRAAIVTLLPAAGDEPMPEGPAVMD